ncbi:MAG: hypothetical protein L0K27_00595 [Corynebacterium nuruki]|nr:hypothetical protein [Corynebacterium nuruki]
MLTEKHPWSRGDMDRYGRSIRDGTEFDRELATDILLWNSELAREAEDIVAAVGRDAPVIVMQVSGRLKTEVSTRQKLQRQSMKLSQMQDYVGVRITVDGGLNDQENLVGLLSEAFLQAGANTVKVKDILEVPHSGYRAVHLHVTAPAGRFEAQVRTVVQDAWANAYEALGDLTGREVRYGTTPDSGPVAGVVTWMQMISESSHAWEQSVALWEQTQEETVVPVDPGLRVFGGVRAYRKLVRDHRISLVYSLDNAGIRFRSLKEAR